MSKGIPLSPKHGVNPCIPVCAFCGQEKNEIALLGKLKGDAEAPKHAIIDFRPCEKCKQNWKQGVALIRVTMEQPENGMPPFASRNGKELYLTGQYAVITPEAAKRCFDMEAENDEKILMDAEAFDDFMLRATAAEE